MTGQEGNTMKKYKATRAPRTTTMFTRAELLGVYDAAIDQLVAAHIETERLKAELETVKRDRDEYRDRAVKLAGQGLDMLKLEQSTRDELDRERRAHAADLSRLNADVAFFKKALARALDHLDGAVMVTDDAPVDRLALDETIDGDMLVRLERATRK